MSNKKVLNFRLKSSKTSALTIIEKVSLPFRIIGRKTLSIIIAGSSSLETYVLNLNTKLSISFQSRITNPNAVSIAAGVYRFIVSSVRERLRQALSISTRSNIAFTPRENLISASAFDLRNILAFVPRELKNVSQTLGFSMGFLVASTPKVYSTLADYDALTLAEMDDLLLKELDYTITPQTLFDSDGNTLIDDSGDILKG